MSDDRIQYLSELAFLTAEDMFDKMRAEMLSRSRRFSISGFSCVARLRAGMAESHRDGTQQNEGYTSSADLIGKRTL